MKSKQIQQQLAEQSRQKDTLKLIRKVKATDRSDKYRLDKEKKDDELQRRKEYNEWEWQRRQER